MRSGNNLQSQHGTFIPRHKSIIIGTLTLQKQLSPVPYKGQWRHEIDIVNRLWHSLQLGQDCKRNQGIKIGFFNNCVFPYTMSEKHLIIKKDNKGHYPALVSDTLFLNESYRKKDDIPCLSSQGCSLK